MEFAAQHGQGYCPAVTDSRDVVVIGGGIAGTAAALAAAGRGARVLLIHAAPGASALCSGGWSGALPAPLAAAFAAVGHEWIEVREALPSPDGRLRPFDFAASSQAAASLTGSTLVCGIAGLPGFRAAILARMWAETSGLALTATEILLPDTSAAGWSPPGLAARLEQDRTTLATGLANAARSFRASRIIVPAVLGLEQVAEVRLGLERDSGAGIGEALGHVPAVPGWRVQKALERMTARAEIAVQRGRVITRTRNGARIETVTIQLADGADRTVRAGAFILASGKYVGGGISGDGDLREPALDCPVWVDHLGERFERVEPLTLTNADRHEDQPLLTAGVTVDEEGRPLDQHGEHVFSNVWVAGAARAGSDPGLGRAATEGWAAGERARA